MEAEAPTFGEPVQAPPPPPLVLGQAADDGKSWEYSLRKYLLLLATLVATVTYAAGFSPPGGVWQDTDKAKGRLAGDPILRNTRYGRYVAFFYCNATAFASSLVVIVLLLLLAVLHDKKSMREWWIKGTLHALRLVMVLDLLSLMGAYAAGACRGALMTIYTPALVSAVFLYLVVQSWWYRASPGAVADDNSNPFGAVRTRKVLMLLATFALSVTYVAGMNAPGGFWDHVEGSHRPGDAMLAGRHVTRLRAFLVCNTTAFVASLLIVVLLLDKKLPDMLLSGELRGCITVALAGLVGAYAAGSCRETDTTTYVLSLVGAVFAYIFFAYVVFQMAVVGRAIRALRGACSCLVYQAARLLRCVKSLMPHDRGNQSNEEQVNQAMEKARSLVLLLATLAATITYQAGLDPPGGLWQDDGDGHKAGDPILWTASPRRYKAFYYCNSVAFVASLLAIVLVQRKFLLKHHVLEAVMILDLFGLIGAYAAGSCRDVSTSIYAMALAGAVLVYVVIHVVFFTLDHEDGGGGKRGDEEVVEKRRKRLLLFAILVATITYQAGLTPPSGFRLQDDAVGGHRAGEPVLLYNYPRRYNAFFYCNSVSFMLSIALIILLVNPHLYRPAIRSYALSVCTAAGLFGLMGAYAAGSTQHIRTSYYIFALVAVVVFVVVALLLLFLAIQERENRADNTAIHSTQEEGSAAAGATAASALPEQSSEEANRAVRKNRADDAAIQERENRAGNAAIRSSREDGGAGGGEAEGRAQPEQSSEAEANRAAMRKKQHAKRKYLMLLGILVASVTYQAGLDPPGGVWQSDAGGHPAGDPVMHDNRHGRFLAFFYSNSISFMASVVVVVLLQLEKPQEGSSPEESKPWLTVMNTTIVLDLLGLLVAYATGSSRRWKTTGYVAALVAAVLGYVGIHVMLSTLCKKARRRRGNVPNPAQVNGGHPSRPPPV